MKPACKDKQNLLQQILGRDSLDELTAAEKLHLEQCEECRLELAKARKLEEKIKTFANISLEQIPLQKINLPEKTFAPQALEQGKITAFFNSLRLAYLFPALAIILLAIFLLKPNPDLSPNLPKLSSGYLIAKNGAKLAPGLITKFLDTPFTVPESAVIEFSGYSIELTTAIARFSAYKVELEKGRLVAQVTKGVPFIVKTSITELSVLGTRFVVQIRNDGANEISVQSGTVKVKNILSGEEKILGQGMQALFPPARARTNEEKTANPNASAAKDITILKPRPKEKNHLLKPADKAHNNFLQGIESHTHPIASQVQSPYIEEPDSPLSLDDLID